MRLSISGGQKWVYSILSAFAIGCAAGFLLAEVLESGRSSNAGFVLDEAPSIETAVRKPGAGLRTPETASGMGPSHAVRSDSRVDHSIPLSEQYDGLRAAADAGDIRAICKLVRSLDYCVNGSRSIEIPDSVLHLAVEGAADAEHGSDNRLDEIATEIEKTHLQASRVQWFCANLPVEKDGELTKRLYQAAQRGDLGAMVRFSLDPPLGQMSLANAEAVSLFMKEAPRLLENAVMHGDMRAVRAMYSAQTTGILDTDFGGIPVDRNPELLAAAANLLRESGDEDTRREVEEYLASAPAEVRSLSASSKVQQLQRRIRSARLRSGSTFAPPTATDSNPPAVCG